MTTKVSISKAIAAVIVIVIIVIAGVGAYYYYISTLPTKPTAPSHTPVTLNVITFTDPSNAWLQAAATSFEQLYPWVTINVIAQGFDSYGTTELTSLEA